MKKSSVLRPVSRNAYARFVERITVVVTAPAKLKAMLAALDSYLDGNRVTYAAALTPDCAMVFEMLRFEIDLAIVRSARARSRTRTHVKPSAAGVIKPADCKRPSAAVVTGNASPEENDTKDDSPRLPRRLRRAVDRRARTKTRWRKL